MQSNDKGILDLKHFVLREVCRLAWHDELTPDKCEEIVYKISPGPKPEYRCCVYKEREIVRGRIRLAMGLSANPSAPSSNVVSVIPAACDDCPIHEYTVTDSCHDIKASLSLKYDIVFGIDNAFRCIRRRFNRIRRRCIFIYSNFTFGITKAVLRSFGKRDKYLIRIFNIYAGGFLVSHLNTSKNKLNL